MEFFIGSKLNVLQILSGDMESMLGDVEISLLALEDTIDAREMQEKQLEQRFQLAMYQERRKAEFNELANRLQNDFEKKKRLQQNSGSSNALKKSENYAEKRLRERHENYPSSSASGTIRTFLYAYVPRQFLEENFV